MALTRVYHESLVQAKRKRTMRPAAVKPAQSTPPPPAPAPAPAPVLPPPVEDVDPAPAIPQADVSPEAPEVFVQRAFQSRLDAAQGRLQAQGQDDGLETLLDRAVTLLESISLHPALRDYSANLRKLEEIEQRLAQATYPN